MTKNPPTNRRADLGRSPDVPRGWALPMLMDIENTADRRLIGPLAVASAERRSAVFAALAKLQDRDQAETPATIRSLAPEVLVEWLLTATPREIVETCHGAIPALAATVAKTGSSPLDAPADYGRIVSILTGTTRRARRQATCLRQSRRITSDYLRSLDLLRDAYLRPSVVAAIGGAAMARQVEQASEVLTRACLGLPDHVLAQSLEQRGADDLRAWVTRMLLRYGYALCDLEDDADLSFLRTGDDFRACGQRYRNCLDDERAGKITNAALGVTAYAEWRAAPVVVELVRLHDGAETFWVCDGIYGVANEPAPVTVQRAIRAHLRQRGIRSLALAHRDCVEPVAVQRLADIDPVGFLWFRQE
ncbi:hypothetical protein [Rhodobacter capsulatus]|jgi:hypothetical protein|uniref:Uncharacterized protein n=1 Tax=Rhodobacter capsulatus (strain ATCC BAA-309 / NBRC 16581 / SB1003) TaxID=272942 RepID=D5ASC5_RHOCB|nr:hypothetical protein [Rhodobacter capsulatus]ADE85016.1 conserved hypothetical protein [Rhodobacter capsulatus SB 1003]ETD02159.1 hypothetical protein U714_07540 [Rhodobacter capsulatus DE442]ETD77849.1 hypothetical protein U717_07715 [Rhodobacter capsulatus R121]ETE54191.1 hypothetical protein U715_07710 [Rhodobacter capsulatus Y262]MDS0926671.1 hypothetical protein [Rhodobacter capsulatus]